MADRHVYSTLPLPNVDPNEYDSIIAAFNSSSNDDSIFIHSGTYTGSGVNVNITFSGKTGITFSNFADDPVTVDADGASNVFAVDGTGMVFDGLHLRDPDFYCLRLDGTDSNNCVVNACTIELGSSGVTGVYGNGTGNDIQVTNCTIYQYNDGSAPGNNTFGVRPASTSTGWVIQGNTFYGVKYPVGINNGVEAIVNRNYFKNLQAGRNNTVYGINAAATSPCVVKNNIFNEMGRALHFNSGDDGDIMFINNHVISSSIACWLPRYLASCSNNIFVGNDTAISGDSGGDQPAPDFNCFFNNGTDVDGYVAATNTVASDPLIENIDGEIYTLNTELSPCVDAGLDVSGDGVTFDYIGTARPQNNIYDIGAYEAPGGSNPYKNGSLAYIFSGDLTKIINSGDIRKILKS